MRRLWKIFTVLVVLASALVVSGVAVLKSIDFSQYKEIIAKEVEKTTGRKLTIKGEFYLDIGLNTVLAIENVSFANAAWGSRRDMMTLERLNIDVKIIPLIMGDIQIERLIMVGLDALFETDTQGNGNWEGLTGAKPAEPGLPSSPSSPTSASSPIPIIQEIDIKKLVVTYRDGRRGTVKKAIVDELMLASEDNKSPLNFNLLVHQKDMKYQAAGTLGSIDTLLNGGKPFEVNVQGNAFDVELALKGTIDRPQKAEGLNLIISVNGDNLEKTLQDIKARIPGLENIPFSSAGKFLGASSGTSIGPFRLAGRIKGSAGQMELSGIDAVIGRKNEIFLMAEGSVANVNQVAGIDMRITTTGGELADSIKMIRPYVPALKKMIVPNIGPYAVSAQAKGSLKALSLSDIDVKIGKPSTVLFSVRGSVANVRSAQGLNFIVGLEGQSLAPVEIMFGVDLPQIPPFNATARISDKGGYTVDKLKVKVGMSDLEGHVSVKVIGAKPSLKAQIESNRIDLDEMFPDESSLQPPSKRPAEGAKHQKLFSQETFNRAAFQAINAEIDLKVGQLKLEGNVIEKLEGRASLVSGKLKIDHLFATLDDGKLVSKLTFDTNAKQPLLFVKADIREFPLGQFLKKADITDALKLTIDAELDVKGQGESPQALMASLKGKTKMIGRKGRINSKFLSGAMSGVSDIIPWFKNEDANKINCFVGRFDINKGVATSKVMFLETSGMSVKGHGNINLGGETLDMTFVPKAKQTSLASFALPMRFKGPLSNPKMSADVSKEAIETVTNVVTTVGSVLLGPVGLLGSLGLNLLGKRDAKKNDPCIKAMGAYSKPKSTQKTAPASKPASTPAATPEPPQKTDKGAVGTAKRNVGNVIEGAGEAAKGIGNALKGLFGGGK